ncbi:hypothetical protein, partial [Sporolactobacillus nakayamae]
GPLTLVSFKCFLILSYQCEIELSVQDKVDDSKRYLEQRNFRLKGTFANNRRTFAHDAYVLYAMRKSSHPAEVRTGRFLPGFSNLLEDVYIYVIM